MGGDGVGDYIGGGCCELDWIGGLDASCANGIAVY